MNNAVARVAGMLAVAVLPLVAGLDGAAYADPELLLPAYRVAMVVSGTLLLAGGVLAALTVRRAPAEPAKGVDGAPVPVQVAHHNLHYAVDGPAMETCPHDGPLEAASGGVNRRR